VRNRALASSFPALVSGFVALTGDDIMRSRKTTKPFRIKWAFIIEKLMFTFCPAIKKPCPVPAS
jgi:hypothetical protein